MTKAPKSDFEYMQLALKLADHAAGLGEVPIGAIVVHQGEIVGEGYNQTITRLDPSAHAEMVAIRQAAAKLGNYRLVDCTLYVTIEPCTMCAGLLVHSRISRLVYGAKESKAGAICSALTISELGHFNHTFEILGGVLEQECSETMTRFFSERRSRQKQLRRNQGVDKDQ